MKYIRLFCFSLLLLFQNATAQEVIVTVQVLPPYSTYLPDYLNNPSKIVFSLLSPRDRDVKIRATITGDNGITVATSASGSAAAPIHLTANQPKMMNGTNLKAYLDVNSVSVSGINKNELYRGSGLPEGSYTFCLQVLDYQTGEPLSQPAPTGCSNPVNIMQINPPTLVAPNCEASIVGNTPQNMVFTWLPAPGVPMGTQYKLKIVELIPNTRNANEAMNSATTPAFFETTTTAYSFFYGPAQPALKDGKRYAWRVTALNPIGTALNAKSNFQNNGHSEVCSFVYQKPAVAQTAPASYGINLIKPVKGEKINSGYGLEFQWTASNKANLAGYELQFTDRYSQDYKITNWNAIPENLFSTMNAFMARKELGKALSEKLPGSWTNGKGKIAWRIRGYDANKKSVDSSRIEIYEIVEAPVADRIKLISPIQGKQITQGNGLKFEWESSKKSSITEYEVQFTGLDEHGKPITNAGNVNEKMFDKKKKNYLASNPTKDLHLDLSPWWTNTIGKFAWRVVGISYGFAVDSSKIETYEIVEDKSEIAQLKGFMMGDYYVQIKSLSAKDQDKLAGTGLIYLWENGKQVEFYFKDIKVRPFAIIPKTQQKQWLAIAGEATVEVYKKLYNNSKFALSTASGCDGTFQANLNTMKITANVQGTMNETTGLFVPTQNNSYAEGKVVAKWFTNFFIPQPGQNWSNQLYEFESAESTVKMSFANKFDGAVTLKNDKVIEGLGNGKIYATFGPADIRLKINGLTGELDLSGVVSVPNAAPTNSQGTGFGEMHLAFKNKKNLNFPARLDQPIKWQMNKDGSVWANISEMYVHLSGTGEEDEKFKNYPDGINFDKFGMLINLPKKAGAETATSLNMNFNGIYNKGLGYTNNKTGEAEIKDAVDIAGFPAKLSKSNFLLNKNKLVWLYVQGSIYVPFLNDWSGIGLNIDSEKLQEASISFDYNKKYFLNKNKGQTYITLSMGRIEGSAIVISPSMHIDSNTQQGVEAKTFYMCDLFIDPGGAVSFDSSFAPNTESVCQGNKQWAKYFGFDFHVDKMKIKRTTIKTDATFLFSGDVILAQGIGTTSKKESGFVFHGKAPDPGSSGSNPALGDYNINNTPVPNTPPKMPKNIFGPSPEEDYGNAEIVENTVEWSDDNKGIQGGYEDGAQKFGGGFKIVTGDGKWGDYFELSGSYQAKEPDCKQLEAKLILGKKKVASPYSYWFFSFYQKGYAAIPIVPGIVEANGFGGTSWFHMKVDYDNNGTIGNMEPNSNYSLGIAATADFRTSFDTGILLKGKATIVTQFYGWSLDGIDYYVNGSALAKDGNSEGLLKARINGSLNWVDKYIDGHGQIWGGIEKVVCINEGQEGEDSLGFHFGADDFYMNVGSPEAPFTAEVLCGSGFSTGVWLNFGKSDLAFGFSNDYDSGWKGLNLGVASAKGRLTSSLNASASIHYSPFQATGDASFSGRAYGKGCVKYFGCIGGSCGVGAKLTVSMPNPVVFSGSMRCDVSRWIPDFTLHASWSSDSGFSISL